MTTRARAAALSALVGALLVVAAAVVAALWSGDVRVHAPPLHAVWGPRLDPRLLGSVAVGLALWAALPGLLSRVGWGACVALTAGASWLWSIALALSDGEFGLSRVFERRSEYVNAAREVQDVGLMLQEFIDRIPSAAPDNWPTHVAGHPPGAFLTFIGMDRLGITSTFWIAIVVVTIGASGVAAVLLTLRELGAERGARRAAPWLALSPAVVWAGVSADWMFAAIAAWGLYLLARAAVRGSVVAALAAGLVLGWCVFLSYGLVLLGVLALAVLWQARSWRPLPWAMLSAVGVAGVFAVLGFAWWEAYPVLRERYFEGIASSRPYWYWVWANLAAWTFTVGLVTWAAFPAGWRRLRERDPLAVLAGAGLLSIVLATLSGMSKAEVERIWLPFGIWVMTLPALLPSRWARPLLLVQVLSAVAVQVLLVTRW